MSYFIQNRQFTINYIYNEEQINFLALEETLADGEFFLSVSYGGKDLYENQWKFCEMEEEDEEDRWIFCPYKPGSYSWVISRKIPNYLPKVFLNKHLPTSDCTNKKCASSR